MLLEKPADSHSPKRIDCYQVTERSTDGAAFKLDPARLVYSLQWKHRAEPPDFELVLRGARDPELWERWINGANLMLLRRQSPDSAFVFATEREGPFTPDAINRHIKRIGERARFAFPVHAHMLRHACGCALANAGHDTRRIQDWLGHRSIQHTTTRN